jgi:hypothetical protein
MRFRRNDRGAITIGDIAMVAITGVVVAALAGPIIVSQSALAYQHSAHEAARATAIAVEKYLSGLSTAPTGATTISYDNNTKQLVFSGTGVHDAISFNLPTGASLPAASGKKNTIISRNEYCIAIDVNGQTSYQSNFGPEENC